MLQQVKQLENKTKIDFDHETASSIGFSCISSDLIYFYTKIVNILDIFSSISSLSTQMKGKGGELISLEVRKYYWTNIQ